MNIYLDRAVDPDVRDSVLRYGIVGYGAVISYLDGHHRAEETAVITDVDDLTSRIALERFDGSVLLLDVTDIDTISII